MFELILHKVTEIPHDSSNFIACFHISVQLKKRHRGSGEMTQHWRAHQSSVPRNHVKGLSTTCNTNCRRSIPPPLPASTATWTTHINITKTKRNLFRGGWAWGADQGRDACPRKSNNQSKWSSDDRIKDSKHPLAKQQTVPLHIPRAGLDLPNIPKRTQHGAFTNSFWTPPQLTEAKFRSLNNKIFKWVWHPLTLKNWQFKFLLRKVTISVVT